MQNLSHFFDFCQERERIRVKKEAGEPWPWTDDVVLQNHFFCNIYREDDKVTRWFRENVRDRVSHDPEEALRATTFFRWFNLPESMELVRHYLLNMHAYHREDVERILRERKARGQNLWSGAYIISGQNADKLTWVLDCYDKFHRQHHEPEERTLQSWHALLEKQLGLGPFMAYEIVTDLTHTSVLRDAPDIMTWTNPGPGAYRGFTWLTQDHNVSIWSKSDNPYLLTQFRKILSASENYEWQRPWTMREVEHSLCEYDKYRRGCNGEKLKRRYHHA